MLECRQPAGICADKKQVLANAGVASRRAAEDLIFEGRVSVNGRVTKVPQTSVHESQDKVFSCTAE